MRYITTALLAIIAAGPAFANPNCGARDDLAKQLAENFNEQQRFVGISVGGNFMETWVSPSGSWTTLMTSPNGTTCIIAAGQSGNILPAGQLG